jgi:hypothetical protein
MVLTILNPHAALPYCTQASQGSGSVRQFGSVKAIKIFKDSHWGSSKGFALEIFTLLEASQGTIHSS